MAPEPLVDYFKHFKKYKDLPDLPDDLDTKHEPNVSYELGRTVTPPPGCDFTVYERHLRERWHCSDTIPSVFDTDDLEKKRQALYIPSPSTSPVEQQEWGSFNDAVGTSASYNDSSRTTHSDKTQTIESSSEAYEDEYNDENDDDNYYDGERTPIAVDLPNWFTVPIPTYPNNSTESIVLITESLDKDELLERYESNVIISQAQVQSISRVPVEARRIRAGSRPPLSKSAYINADSSVVGGGRRPSISASTKTPRYFPFRSRILGGAR